MYRPMLGVPAAWEEAIQMERFSQKKHKMTEVEWIKLWQMSKVDHRLRLAQSKGTQEETFKNKAENVCQHDRHQEPRSTRAR